MPSSFAIVLLVFAGLAIFSSCESRKPKNVQQRQPYRIQYLPQQPQQVVAVQQPQRVVLPQSVPAQPQRQVVIQQQPQQQQHHQPQQQQLSPAQQPQQLQQTSGGPLFGWLMSLLSTARDTPRLPQDQNNAQAAAAADPSKSAARPVTYYWVPNNQNPVSESQAQPAAGQQRTQQQQVPQQQRVATSVPQYWLQSQAPLWAVNVAVPRVTPTTAKLSTTKPPMMLPYAFRQMAPPIVYSHPSGPYMNAPPGSMWVLGQHQPVRNGEWTQWGPRTSQ